MVLIKDENKKSLCKKLGYNNLKPCLEKLDFLEKNGIEKFLESNFKYDFVLGSELFLKRVIELCGNDEDMQIFKKTKKKLSKQPGRLFVNTNFKRKSEPVFVLAFMEGKRNIRIDRKEFDTKDEEFKYVKNFIKNHYRKNKGELSLWGKIQDYVYESDSFDKKLVFDVDGNLIKEVDNFAKSKATLMVKNKEIKIN
jgi:hypothetical protein